MDNAPKKKVLITGVSGLLGSNLAFCWKDYYSIRGLYNQHAVSLPGTEAEQVDLLDSKALKRTVKDFRPDIIVHSAALANVDMCEMDHVLADRMNVEATRHVCAVAGGCGAKMVHISTDAVYDGTKGNFSENDPVHAVNHYAKTKIEAEQAVLSDARALVVRTSFYGINVQPKQCLAEWIIAELSQKQPIKGFTDSISSNIYTSDLADILKAAIEKDLKGAYNMACSDALSKYDFAVAIAGSFGLDTGLISPASVDDFPFKARRGKNLSLNVRKLEKALGCEIIGAHPSLEHFCKDYYNRRN